MQKYVLIVQFLQKGIFANDNILWLFYLYVYYIDKFPII